MVVRAFNNKLFFSITEKVYALELIPNYKPKSKNFDFVKLPVKTVIQASFSLLAQ
jgi:hypothetical protein